MNVHLLVETYSNVTSVPNTPVITQPHTQAGILTVQ